MECAAKRDDLVLRVSSATRPLSRELDCSFVRLCAWVSQKSLRGERFVHKRRRQLFAGLCRVEIRDVDQAVSRGVHRGPEARVAVAERIHSDATDEIEVALSRGID